MPQSLPMPEIDHVWSKIIDDAANHASKTGRHDLTEYLRLRASNDEIRRAGVNWLFDTAIGMTARIPNQSVTIHRDEPHNFARGTSNMVGSRLEIRLGVRCLTVEAGWVRTPKDGVMREGALAFARISHFGMPKHTSEYRLVRSEPLPNWVNEEQCPIDSNAIERHLRIFLDR